MTSRHTALKIAPAIAEALALSIIAAGIALIGYGLIAPVLETFPDTRQLLAQYATAARADLGFVFNPSERVLLVPAPLYILSAALTSSSFLFAVALGGAAGLTYLVGRHMDYPRHVAALAGGVVGLGWPLWAAAGTPYPIAAALCTLALIALLSERPAWAGLCMAAAVLCAPEAVIPAALGGRYLRVKGVEGADRRYVGVVAGVLGLAAIGLTLYYGPTWLPDLIGTPRLPPTPLDALTAPYVIALVAAALPVWNLRRKDPLKTLLGAWVLFVVVIDVVVLRADASGPYSLIVIPSALLAVEMFRRYPIVAVLTVFVAMIAGLMVALTGPSRPLPPVIPRLPTTKHIAAPDTLTALRLPHLSRQTITALDGGLQPELRRFLEREDRHSALIRYAPDVILRGAEAWGELPAAAALGYTLSPTGDYFLRSKAVGDAFVSRDADQMIGESLRVTAYGTDRDRLRAGTVVRLRLTWDIPQNAAESVQVTVRLADGQRVLATTTDTFGPSVFQRGQWTTYHVLALPPDIGSGDVGLLVGVRVGAVEVAPVLVGVVGLE